MSKFHEEALKKLIAWAESDDNVRALVLTGSGAREDMDELSDLDVELYVREPSKLLNESDWYKQFGHVLAVEALPNPDWHPTRLVYYVNGKIDFMIAPVHSIDGTTYARQFRVLVDKDSKAQTLRLVPSDSGALPTQAEYDECNNWFWAAALMCAKCVVRNEPWLAKMRDWDAKSQLIRMIEWDHKARYGENFDTWYLGKHLNSWVDADIRRQLDDLWVGLSVSDTARALDNEINLFAGVAERTAQHLELKQFASDLARKEVMRILALAENNKTE